MLADTIEQIFSALAEANPSPTTELRYINNFTLLVAVVLSAQSTDVAVNKACHNLFLQYDTPQKILELGIEGLKGYIKTIGLYNVKAANIIALCERLIEAHNCTVPNSFAQLIQLPGVGRKTANVVMNCAFGAPTIAVDTHVLRVAQRLGLTRQVNPNKAEIELTETIPAKWQLHAHNWLVLHGRYICKAQKPKCNQCRIAKYCLYYHNHLSP